jgi:hypothetical protein
VGFLTTGILTASYFAVKISKQQSTNQIISRRLNIYLQYKKSSSFPPLGLLRPVTHITEQYEKMYLCDIQINTS